MRPDFSFEDKYDGQIVCGIDEVGRGPLAGPVVAAAVILNRQTLPKHLAETINDSKKLSAQKRAFLFDQLHHHARIGMGQCSVAEIDQLNILQATLLAMQRAFENLPDRPQVAFIDGNKTPKLPCKTETIIKGDARCLSIAAASIIAKHHRDELMNAYAIDFPYYKWESNAGYGTAQHLKAIEIHGITHLHRRSFSPISKLSLKEFSANN